MIILSFIGGLRSFDLIWAMTRGGPGFTTDVIASMIYKQYQAGFYGLSTAGNVVLFVAGRASSCSRSAGSSAAGRSSCEDLRRHRLGAIGIALLIRASCSSCRSSFIVFTAAKDRGEAAELELRLADELADHRQLRGRCIGARD